MLWAYATTATRWFVIALSLLIVGCNSSNPSIKKEAPLRIALPYEPETLDPHARSTISSYCLTANFYEPLVASDANMKLHPCLAQFWENPDPTTWIFHLQPGVHFHDGKLLEPRDVVYSFQRLLTNKNLDVSALLTDVSEVKAIDANTVRIRTQVPISIFLNKISFITIIPDGSSDRSLVQHVNGTGPYKLELVKQDSVVQMSRNENYWRSKAEIPEVTYYFNRSPEKALQDLKTGDFGLVLCNSKKLKGAVQEEDNFEMELHDSLSVKYLAWDMLRDRIPDCDAKTNPFKNRLVRQALQLGIDRQQLISALPIYAATTNQIVPPFVFGFNAAISPPAYNLAKARALLDQAGFAQGFTVTLTARQILMETAGSIQQQLQNIGIHANLRILPDPKFFDALNNRQASFYLSKLSTTTGDASDVLEAALHSPDGRGFGIYNWGDYQNKQVDAAIEQSMQILAVDERRYALEKIMSSVMDDLAWLPLYVDQEVYAVNKSLSWQPRNDGLVLAYEIKQRHR